MDDGNLFLRFPSGDKEVKFQTIYYLEDETFTHIGHFFPIKYFMMMIDK